MKKRILLWILIVLGGIVVGIAAVAWLIFWVLFDMLH